MKLNDIFLIATVPIALLCAGLYVIGNTILENQFSILKNQKEILKIINNEK